MNIVKKTVLTLLVSLYGVTPITAFRIGSTEFLIDLDEGKENRIVKINHDFHEHVLGEEYKHLSEENVDETIDESNQSKKRVFFVEMKGTNFEKEFFLGKIMEACKKRGIEAENIDLRDVRLVNPRNQYSSYENNLFFKDVLSNIRQTVARLEKDAEACKNEKLKIFCQKELEKNFSKTKLKEAEKKLDLFLENGSKKEEEIRRFLFINVSSQLLDLNALLKIDKKIREGFDPYIYTGLNHGEKIANTIKQIYNVKNCKEEGTVQKKNMYEHKYFQIALKKDLEKRERENTLEKALTNALTEAFTKALTKALIKAFATTETPKKENQATASSESENLQKTTQNTQEASKTSTVAATPEKTEKKKESEKKSVAPKIATTAENGETKSLTKKIVISAAVAGGIGYGTYRLVKWWWNRK